LFEAETEGVCLKSLPDTVNLHRSPKAEVAVVVDQVAPDNLAGSRFSVPNGYDESIEDQVATIYYVEHQPIDNNEVEVLSRKGDVFHVRWTGTTTDVNHYDGSQPDTRVEIDGAFVFKGIDKWSHVAQKP
jgi:hypothetical protein